MDQALLKDFFEEENTHWWHSAKRKMIRTFLPQAQGRALVLGIGGGLLCHELAKTFEVTGVDIATEACKHVKSAYGIDTLVCDLERGLPFATEKFDVIIIADVLEHVHRDKELLTEIRRCLVPGGSLFLTVPAYAHMWSYWDERLHHCRRYEYEDLKSLIAAQDFSIKKITFFNALLYPAAFLRRKIFGDKEKETSDFKMSQGGGLVNTLIGFYYRTERGWLRWGDIPFGLSLFVHAEKS